VELIHPGGDKSNKQLAAFVALNKYVDGELVPACLHLGETLTIIRIED